MKDLVVITGGNSGLGLEIVKKFIENHFEVLSISRSKRDELFGDVHYEYGDASNETFVKSVFLKYGTSFNIKYLINNAGLGIFGEPETNTAANIDKVLDSNLKAMILCTTYAIPYMRNAEDLNFIVNIASTAAIKGNKNESLYCAAKWGARGFTESLKATFKGTKTKVIGVYPGGMNTEFWNNNHDYTPIEKCNTFMSPADVASIIYNNITAKGLAVQDMVIERL